MKTSKDFRLKADSARDSCNWPVAAFSYAKMLEFNPRDAGIWLQLGHALKGAGMLARAQAAYEHARNLNAADPEAHVQLAILAKCQGEFGRAISLFEKARELGYRNLPFIDVEVAFLQRTSAERPGLTRQVPTRFKIFLSACANLPEERNVQNLKSFLGGTNYSYAYALKGFKQALDQAGYDCEIIHNPHYIPDVSHISTAERNIHLGFFPPDGPRYLKGAFNVLCVAWEFERLKRRQETLSYHSFADPAQMLSMADEIWTTSQYGEEALRRSGLRNVQTVPTPVPVTRQEKRTAPPGLDELYRIALKLDRITWAPLGIWPTMQSTLSEQSAGRARPLLSHLLERDDAASPIFFVSIFNVHDFRKQIRPLVEAFSYFAKTKNKNAYLLLKISAIDTGQIDVNRILWAAQINEDGDIINPLVSSNILISTDALSRDEMDHLYDFASFYICTPHAEGQNLPLIEAMGRGLVPVSVDHTAMQEYITPENAVVIQSEYRPMGPRLAARYGMYDMGTYFVDSSAVLAALRNATGLTDTQYSALSGASIQTVGDKYGLDAFTSKVKDLIERICNTSGEA